MILVDTSVWVDHIEKGVPWLGAILDRQRVVTHPLVIGELACGQMKGRKAFLERLSEMPRAVVARDEEVLDLIERQKLMGRGVSYVDLHLVTSALLSRVAFWTRDKRLATIAFQLRLAPSLGQR